MLSPCKARPCGEIGIGAHRCGKGLLELLLLIAGKGFQRAQFCQHDIAVILQVFIGLLDIGLAAAHTVLLAFVDYLIRQVDDVEVPLIGYVLHKVAQLFAHVLGPLEREIVKDISAIHHGRNQLFVLKHVGNGLELLQLLHALREQGFHR